MSDMQDSVKDAQVCTNDHASQKATMNSSVVPQDLGHLKSPGSPQPLGDKALSGVRTK